RYRGSRRGRRRDPRHHGTGRRGQVDLAVLHAAAVQQLVPGRHLDGQRGTRTPDAEELYRPGGRPPWTPRGGGWRYRTTPSAERSQLRAGGGRVRQAEVHVHLVGDRAEHVQVGPHFGHVQRGLKRATAAFPVHERAGLLGDRGHREHHVRAVGDRARPQLEADDERRHLQRRERRLRVGQVGRINAGYHQAAELLRGRRLENLGGIPALPAGKGGLA